MSLKALTAVALKHLTDGGKILAIGHSSQPESIYNNSQLYPKMFPQLFPYGLGGIGNKRGIKTLSDFKWKKHLLLYHNKRFQTDSYFPLIAFNHEQIKQATEGGFVLTKQSKFESVTNRLLNLNLEVLANLAKRLSTGEHIKPKTDKEKACFDLINDLDSVSHKVKGSISSKKHMRNEIWSTIAYAGAPTWFITFAPADIKHPLCLYYADKQVEFNPDLFRTSDERYVLIAHNPVAGARFFHKIVELFIKHVLGVGSNHNGLYGKTKTYYGTVEQQGRLTLHLHLMLWIENALTPQQIRDRLMKPDSVFQEQIIQYLESCHIGEFNTGTLEEVRDKVIKKEKSKGYKNPTETLPIPVPSKCKLNCNKCNQCVENKVWWENLPEIIDDIILKSNIYKYNKKMYK